VPIASVYIVIKVGGFCMKDTHIFAHLKTLLQSVERKINHHQIIQTFLVCSLTEAGKVVYSQYYMSKKIRSVVLTKTTLTSLTFFQPILK